MDEIVEELRAAGSVFAEDEAAMLVETASSPDELAAMVQQRVGGVPVQQIVGWADFCGLRILLEPGVFVPRHKTEFLVEKAIGLGSSGDVVLDLCCGTGAIGIAVSAGLQGVELHAADIDPTAVKCARRNVLPVGGRVWDGDLYEPLPDSLRGRVNLLLANAPYVPTREVRLMPRESRLHEEMVTLDGGEDGLEIQRRVIEGASDWLAPGGRLLIETSDVQAEGTIEVMKEAGFSTTVSMSRELNATVATGTRR
ncbi:MAG: putative protein N(5)-glutamine methyltransferase [Solirubrobacterales bacterium]